MDYSVIERPSIHELNVVVKFYIKNGWVPQGGVAVSRDYYLQAMVRYDVQKG